MTSPMPSTPERVLDVGCGNGAWILNARSQWKETFFVGLDLVDIQPRQGWWLDRVQWVHHNFLKEELPFKDETFDFIRVKGIARGVPEHAVGASSV
jgi:ubiquinone/menaquinone biosynthesis C-methylase UbiE